MRRLKPSIKTIISVGLKPMYYSFICWAKAQHVKYIGWACISLAVKISIGRLKPNIENIDIGLDMNNTFCFSPMVNNLSYHWA